MLYVSTQHEEEAVAPTVTTVEAGRCYQNYNMSSEGDDRLSREQEQEDFYDCQESLETPGQKGGGGEGGGGGGGGDQDSSTDELTDKGDCGGRLQEGEKLPEEDRENKNGLQEEEHIERLQWETPTERLQEEEEHIDRLVQDAQKDGLQQDPDSELKAEDVEFDDDYLRELEKNLTEEEKESRRQQSLTLKEKGNSQFKSGDWREAEQSYKEALQMCPVCFNKERAILFSNRAAARLHLDQTERAISDCTRAITLNPDYLRALLRRAELYEKTDKLEEALEDYKKILERDPGHTNARQACMRLPQQIQERNEKLKEEMMTKLKELGNMVLRPFGLSTNNFQVNQDPNTGSYSVNFNQNPKR